ncbi:hypothetical protein M5362_14080 [Streptomyces sp. Je 1-79]|uniref:hypothetical protein n=1 Tax=Streptomyces sp. Je 1-79 TaxID=2943847 RepID=UPI0021A3F8CC|nr:hypothetical protein [Streptomyces sp. Je 1-79]MCT4354259.1 hypothetical protein [Streptomyces sp. Je 1-79]
MLEESLTALAAAGGGAVVAAMATDAWQVTRDGVVRLFRGRAEVEGRLEEDAALVAGAENAGEARQALVPAWALRLGALLAEHPEYADELRALIRDTPGAQHSVQHNTAHGNGRVFGVQHGNIVFHQGPEPRPDA